MQLLPALPLLSVPLWSSWLLPALRHQLQGTAAATGSVAAGMAGGLPCRQGWGIPARKGRKTARVLIHVKVTVRHTDTVAELKLQRGIPS